MQFSDVHCMKYGMFLYIYIFHVLGIVPVYKAHIYYVHLIDDKSNYYTGTFFLEL